MSKRSIIECLRKKYNLLERGAKYIEKIYIVFDSYYFMLKCDNCGCFGRK